MGLSVVIAVLDAGAHLKAFQRMDGAVLASIDIAIRKASTAVLLSQQRGRLGVLQAGCSCAGPRADEHAAWLRSAAASRSREPDGRVIGALGVSGGAVAQDVEVAQALPRLPTLTR